MRRERKGGFSVISSLSERGWTSLRYRGFGIVLVPHSSPAYGFREGSNALAPTIARISGMHSKSMLWVLYDYFVMCGSAGRTAFVQLLQAIFRSHTRDPYKETAEPKKTHELGFRGTLLSQLGLMLQALEQPPVQRRKW